MLEKKRGWHIINDDRYKIKAIPDCRGNFWIRIYVDDKEIGTMARGRVNISNGKYFMISTHWASFMWNIYEYIEKGEAND